MNNLREKIADHIEAYMPHSEAVGQRRKYALDEADAILALIRANVPPLVWVKERCDESIIHPDDQFWCHRAQGCIQYVVEDYDAGDVWLCIPEQDEVEITDDVDVIKAAKAAANEHHRQAVLKAAGLSHE